MTTAMRARPVAYEVSFEALKASDFIRELRLAFTRQADDADHPAYKIEDTPGGFTVDDDYITRVSGGADYEFGLGTVTIEVRATSQEAAIRRVTRRLARLGLGN